MNKNKAAALLDGINYWSVVIIPFSIVIGLGAANVFIVIMAASYVLAKLIKREKFSVGTPVNLSYGVLLFFVLLSLKNTLYLDDSLGGLQRWFIEYPLLFLGVTKSVKDKKHIRLIIVSIALSVSISGIDAVWQLITGKDFIWRNAVSSCPISIDRPSASFNNPNILGIYLSILTPVLAGIGLFCTREKTRIFNICAFLLGTMGVFLTLSRGSGLGLWIALLTIAIARKSKLLAGVLIVSFLIFPFAMPKNIKNWAKEVKYNPVVFMLNYDRISIYKNSVNMIKHNPLTGVGINTFGKNYERYKLPEPEYAQTPDNTYAHNIYLHTAGEIGLLGLTALLFFLVTLYQTGIPIYFGMKDKHLKILSVSILAGITAFLVNGLTETSLYYPTVVPIFWFLVGLLLSLKKFADR